MLDNKKNSLGTLSNCLVCGRSFGEKDLIALEKKTEKTIIHATCSKCNGSTLLFLFSGSKGLVSMGMITDLDRAEVKSKFGAYAISTDEVLDAHSMIDSCQGNLKKIFSDNI